MKKILGIILFALATSSHAQLGLDLTNMVLQIKEMAEKMQSQTPTQTEQISSSPPESQLQPTAKPIENSSTVSCFIADTENMRWATGGQMITSCDPDVIEGQITQQFAMISIWQFLNDRQIKRSWIFSAKARANSKSQIDTYERKGKRIIENVGGCMTPFEIINETADSITIKDLPTSGGNCTATQIDAGKDLSRRPPSKYIKIKG